GAPCTSFSFPCIFTPSSWTMLWYIIIHADCQFFYKSSLSHRQLTYSYFAEFRCYADC
ncbi:hypothetical protein X975_19544, partial [Stegodyphus mimosarum]